MTNTRMLPDQLSGFRNQLPQISGRLPSAQTLRLEDDRRKQEQLLQLMDRRY